jgi:Carbon dioxide concentrating mechanism/carboxysome shell protein
MQAIGLIETRGFLPAIEGADAMLKTAQVELVGRTFAGGGLVTITVTGDVGAVKAAVEAGVTAVERIGHLLLISRHVIPRPHHDIESIILTTNKNNLLQSKNRATESTELTGIKKGSINSAQIPLKNFRKEEVDALVQKFGLEKSLEVLKSLSMVKLRNLTKEYKGLGVTGRAILKANKELLIELLKGYYERESNK